MIQKRNAAVETFQQAILTARRFFTQMNALAEQGCEGNVQALKQLDEWESRLDEMDALAWNDTKYQFALLVAAKELRAGIEEW